MFVIKETLKDNINKTVKVVGKLVRVEAPELVISTYDGDIHVIFSQLHRYTDKMFIVTGKVTDNLKIKEEYVDSLTEDFCLKTYSDMVKISNSCISIFES